MASTVEMRDGQLVVVRSGKGADADAVRREARILRTIAGPGVQRVADAVDDGTQVALVIEVAPPLDLSRVPVATARYGLAAIAEVLQRANDSGFAHGPIRDEDVLGRSTSPLLAGWHRSTEYLDDDVVEFGRFVERLARQHTELRGIAARALAPDPPTLAALADALRQLDAPPVLRRASTRSAIILGPAVATAMVMAAIGLPRSETAHDPRERSRPQTEVRGNVVVRAGTRWTVGQPGDVVVTGRWRCDDVELPAVLRPSSGRVWLFTTWPDDDESVAGRRIVDIPAGTRLVVRRTASCDRLEVIDAQGRSTVVG